MERKTALPAFVWVATLPTPSFPRKPRLVIPAKAGIQTLRANPVGALYERFVQRERGSWMDSRPRFREDMLSRE